MNIIYKHFSYHSYNYVGRRQKKWKVEKIYFDKMHGRVPHNQEAKR